AADADLTITISRSDLVQVMMGAVSFDDQIKSGKAKLKGNRDVYEKLKPMLVHFTPDFEMMPGTRPVKAAEPAMNTFEQAPLGNTDGG
ncbi:SCP2 sterol-binding domain-containing protein, partial [Desulfosarcina sp.]|nr:SCP2 sterol-binding domain-containing protein [Desulfosarcina sp.]